MSTSFWWWLPPRRTRSSSSELAAGLVDLAHERGVVLLGEVRLTRMRAPEQPAHVHAAPGEVASTVPISVPGPSSRSSGSPSPIGEVHPVAALERRQLVVEPAEVLGPVDEDLDALPSVHARPSPRRRSIAVAALPRSAGVRNQSSTTVPASIRCAVCSTPFGHTGIPPGPGFGRAPSEASNAGRGGYQEAMTERIGTRPPCRRGTQKICWRSIPTGSGMPTTSPSNASTRRQDKRWHEQLGRATFARRLAAGDHDGIAHDAVRIEARTNLLFSFEKIAIRDAVSSPGGAKEFAEGIFEWLYGRGRVADRFDRWRDVVSELPRRQTRVVTWPVLTVFGFIARPRVHLILKPNVTRRAARAYGFEFPYSSQPRSKTYESLLRFGATVREDLADWKPRDLIDIQSFIWVLGSEEYD